MQHFVWEEGDSVVVCPGERPRRPAGSRAGRNVELAKIRRAREVTQNELAEQPGVGQEQISRLGRRGDFHMSTVLEYLKGLDVTDVELTLTSHDVAEMVLLVFLVRSGSGR